MRDPAASVLSCLAYFTERNILKVHHGAYVKAESYSAVWMDHILLICSPIGGHLALEIVLL